MLSECAEGCFVHYDAVLKQFTEDRHFVDPNAKLTEPEATKAKEIRQRQIELTSKAMEATLSQFKCEAQLRLLGENLCCDSLMKYLAKSQELFDLPTSNEAEYNRVYSEKKAVADTVTDLRDAYLAELQKAFKRYD